MKKISVCYVLSYYSPRYVRTESLIKALQSMCEVELFQARNTRTNFLRYFETLWKLIVIRVRYNPQFYILGFRGYELFWIVRLLTLGKILFYDHMMSPYDSLLNEHKVVRKGSLLDWVIYRYERTILNASRLILTDTELHRRFFHQLFDVPLEKIAAIPVGTDEEIFHPEDSAMQSHSKDNFEVLYYGSFLPLHGIDIILKAAIILRDKPIRFTLIGGNRFDLSWFHRQVREFDLENLRYIDWVEFDQLPQIISRASIGLGGPFGGTGQAGRVITGKTFQFLAMAKPVVIGNIPGGFDGFVDKQNCFYIPQGDEQALADAILWAFEHPNELQEVGRRGYELFKNRYSTEKISTQLGKILGL